MSKEYFAVKGSNFYLIDLCSNEGYAFSEFGKGIGSVNAKYVISICNVLSEVDILSILSDSTANISEIYYKGKRAIVNGNGINVYKKIPSYYPKKTFIAFRIVRSEFVGLTQILIPFEKGCVTESMLSSVFKVRNWF